MDKETKRLYRDMVNDAARERDRLRAAGDRAGALEQHREVKRIFAEYKKRGKR